MKTLCKLLTLKGSIHQVYNVCSSKKLSSNSDLTARLSSISWEIKKLYPFEAANLSHMCELMTL